GAVVGALQVDGVDRARGGELLDEVVAPVARRIELEARRRVARQQLPEHDDRLEALRDDEVHRAGLSAHGIGERALGLAQREVERGALEPPPAVVVERVALERLREAVERVLSGDGKIALRRVELRVVGDVFADAFLTSPAQPDHRRHAREATRHVLLETVELVALYTKRKRGKGLVQTHERMRSATV